MKDHCPNIYEVEDLAFSYLLGKQKIEALTSISLKIPQNTLVTFSGPSGSGKSTLLNVLGFIEPVQEGRVLFLNEDIVDFSESRKNEIRKFHVGFIFQHFHLIPVLTAEENVRYFLTLQNLSKAEIHERTEDVLQAVGLWEHRKKKPSQLSGGQKQRVAIARAVAKHPKVIIGDEPTASLDQKTGGGIMELLSKMVETRDTSIVLTTHDPMVQSFSQMNFHLQDGQIAYCEEK